MKILEHGDPRKINPVIRFKCNNCGCMFEANREEYSKKVLLGVNLYFCDCPECGEPSDELNA